MWAALGEPRAARDTRRGPGRTRNSAEGLPARHRFWVLDPSPCGLELPHPRAYRLGLGDLPAIRAEVLGTGQGTQAPASHRPRPRPRAGPTSRPPSQSRRATSLKGNGTRSCPCVMLWPFSCPGPSTRPPATPDLGCGLTHVRAAAGPWQDSGSDSGAVRGAGGEEGALRDPRAGMPRVQAGLGCRQAWGCNPGPHNSNSSVNAR